MNCSHNMRKTIEVHQCQICGTTKQTRVVPKQGIPPTVLVRQGLLTADILIDTLGFDGHDADYLRSIEPCKHPAESIARKRCKASGKMIATCSGCGRKWNDVSGAGGA